jgi:hypothetical protein
MDASDDRRVVEFLNFTSSLGTTVFWGLDNLNTITREINSLMRNLQHSCDFLIKMDTDEFLVMINSTKLPVSHSEILPYLDKLKTNGSRLRVGFDMMSSPTLHVCCRNISEPLTTTEFQSPRKNEALKGFFTAWTFKSVDLGAHGGSVLGDFQSLPPQVTRLGLAHYHWLCYDQLQLNNRKALLSHSYLKNLKSDYRLQIGSLEKHLGRASGHKVKDYLNHLKNPMKSREEYYTEKPHGEHQFHVRTKPYLNWTDIRDVVRANDVWGFSEDPCRAASLSYLEELGQQGVANETVNSAWNHFITMGMAEGKLWPGVPCASMCKS